MTLKNYRKNLRHIHFSVSKNSWKLYDMQCLNWMQVALNFAVALALVILEIVSLEGVWRNRGESPRKSRQSCYD